MSLVHDSEIWRSILESLPNGLCVVDGQKKVLLWSDGAERISGRQRHEVIGHSCIAEPLLHCDQPGCEFCSEECPAARAIKTSQPAEALGFVHHKAGHEIPVRIRAVPLHDQRGSIIGAVEVFDDLEQELSGQPDDSLPGSTDPITGVLSRTRIEIHLRDALAVFAQSEAPFSLLLFCLEGLDNFRAALGSEAASALLRVVARTLEVALWRTDFVGRWNDNQFLVILTGCHGGKLQSVRERIRRMLANDSIEWWGDRHSLPVSIGEASARLDDTIETLLDRLTQSLDAASAWRIGASGADANASSGS